MANLFEKTVVQMIIENPDKWYNGYQGVYFEPHEQVGYKYKNGGHGIVDLVIYVFRPSKYAAGNIYNFEIKSCEGDLNSGRGINLFGMYNYLVYPRSQITTLPGILTYEKVERKLAEIGCDHAGIIGVISDTDFVVERRAKRYNGDGMPIAIKPHKF